VTTNISSYDQQAIDFLAATDTTFESSFLRNGKYFPSDKEPRDIYQITLRRGNREYKFNFGQSISDSGFYYTKGRSKYPLPANLLSKKRNEIGYYIKQKIDWDFLNNSKSDIIHYPIAPNAYSVLACLQKYDVGTFENFCSEFGYDTDSKTAEKTYLAVKDEYLNVCRLFTNQEIELLQEIN